MRTLYCHFGFTLAPNQKLFFLCFYLFCRFLQTFPHTWCLKDAVDRMQHYGHSICHFRPMVMRMGTMGKRKLTKHTKAMSRKHTQKMPMVIRENVNPMKWLNWECFFSSSSSIQGGAGAGLQYPAYFKDAKGNNHSVFGANSLGSLQYLKPGQKGGMLDVLQQGRNAGMPLYVRCPICQKEFKQKSTLLQHGCIHIESR